MMLDFLFVDHSKPNAVQSKQPGGKPKPGALDSIKSSMTKIGQSLGVVEKPKTLEDEVRCQYTLAIDIFSHITARSANNVPRLLFNKKLPAFAVMAFKCVARELCPVNVLLHWQR
jgi:hypothetical protein